MDGKRDIPRIGTTLALRDFLGSAKVRLGIGRSRYRVAPGLYAVGNPQAASPVLVSANYKKTFDALRSSLKERDVWLLILDTKGINVWCAAGKGTFGTAELIERIRETRLSETVDHRNLILPQLGATGVSAHKVRELSGWKVKFGPVRAADIPRYLDSGMRASPEMRRVRFPLVERLVLTPLEMVLSLKYVVPSAVLFFVLSGVSSDGISFERMIDQGPVNVFLLLLAWITGVLLSPVFLPWLPGRSFSFKGAFMGLAVLTACFLFNSPGRDLFLNRIELSAWFLLLPSISSVLMLNFTGCSTYTSLSGVRIEMRYAIPLQIALGGIGFLLWTVAKFV